MCIRDSAYPAQRHLVLRTAACAGGLSPAVSAAMGEILAPAGSKHDFRHPVVPTVPVAERAAGHFGVSAELTKMAVGSVTSRSVRTTVTNCQARHFARRSPPGRVYYPRTRSPRPNTSRLGRR